MPMVGEVPSKRGYVVLGNHSSWESGERIPRALEFLDGQRQEIKKETHDWMCRGIDLSELGADGPQILAKLETSDGSKEDVKINVETVC